MAECYLYIIECKNGNYYTGITNNWMKRWRQHETGRGAKYIRTFGFNRPVFLISFPTKSQAMKEERRIKSLSRYQKIQHMQRTRNMVMSARNHYNERFQKLI